MESEVPLVFANGYPTSLEKMTEQQLRRFLNYLWDYTKVPSGTRILPGVHVSPEERMKLLKKGVTNIYERLGCSYLLGFSEGLANSKTTSLLFDVDHQQECVFIWNKLYRRILVKIPQSNLTYDASAECSDANSLEEQRQQQKQKPKGKSPQSAKKSQHTGEKTPQTISQKKAKSPPPHQLTRSVNQPQTTEVITIDADDDSDVLEISDDETPQPQTASKSHHTNSNPLQTSSQKKSNDIAPQIASKSQHTVDKTPQTISQKKVPDSVPESLIELDPDDEPLPGVSHNQVSDNEAESLIELDPDDEPLPGVSHNKDIIEIEDETEESTVIFDLDDESQEESQETPQETEIEEGNQVSSECAVIELSSDSEEESSDQRGIGVSATTSSRSFRRSPKKRRRREPDVGTVSQPKETDVLLPEESEKATFLNNLGLCDVATSPDDPIILPELNKTDFVKFHRLPLHMIPALATRGLIDPGAIVPGPPGQNSCSFTDFTNLSDKRRRSDRKRTPSIRHKSSDIANAREYKFPKKTYKAILSGSVAPQRKKQKIHSRETDTSDTMADCPTQIKEDKKVVYRENAQSDNVVQSPGPIPTNWKDFKLKECKIVIRELNPYLLKFYGAPIGLPSIIKKKKQM